MKRHLAWAAARLLPLLLLGVAWHLKHPLLYGLRHLETPLLLLLALAGLAWRRGFPGRLPAALLLAVLVVTLVREGEYQSQRAAVLAGNEALRTVGAHFIVGFSDFAELRPLAAGGLIGGIYLAKRNLRGRSLAGVAAEIAALQAIRQPGGEQAVQLKVAQQAVEAFAQLAQKNKTMIVPSNLAEVSGIIGTAMALMKTPVPRPG